MSGSGVLYKDGALRSSAEGGQNGAKCRVRISCALRFLLLLIAEIGERKGIQIKRAGGVSGFGFDGCGERGKIRIRFVHGTGSASEHESKSKTRQGPGHGGTSSIGSRSQKTQARFERQFAAWPLTDCEDVGRFGTDFCEDTGEPIGLKRLDARPIATLSVEAQERHERREKVYREE